MPSAKCPDYPHYTPEGYPCCNETFNRAVEWALAKHGGREKIHEAWQRYVESCAKFVRDGGRGNGDQ